MFGTPTLRWYLARRFTTSIIAAFLLCSVLIFMIDFIEMLRQAGNRGEVQMTRVLLLTALRLPAYTELLITFAVLVATIGTLLQLNRKNELAVMRAGGLSVWQFVRPGIVVAALFGIFGVAVYNPLAAASRAEAERQFAEAYGRESNFLKSAGNSNWIRQDSVDGASVLHGGAVTNSGLTLTSVTAFRFNEDGTFKERIAGERAELKPGYWHITNAIVSTTGQPPETYADYHLATYLSPERVRDILGPVISVSIWELPGLIDLANKAGLSSARYEVQLQLLLSRPFLLMAMVLLGATVSLKSFRGGGIQNMVLVGMGIGITFFLGAEISRQIGVSGLVAPVIAVWVPVGIAWLLALTILLRQEDG